MTVVPGPILDVEEGDLLGWSQGLDTGVKELGRDLDPARFGGGFFGRVRVGFP